MYVLAMDKWYLLEWHFSPWNRRDNWKCIKDLPYIKYIIYIYFRRSVLKATIFVYITNKFKIRLFYFIEKCVYHQWLYGKVSVNCQIMYFHQSFQSLCNFLQISHIDIKNNKSKLATLNKYLNFKHKYNEPSS